MGAPGPRASNGPTLPHGGPGVLGCARGASGVPGIGPRSRECARGSPMGAPIGLGAKAACFLMHLGWPKSF